MGGAHIPELIKNHDAVEEKLKYIKEFDSEYIDQVDWAIYTVLHSQAKKKPKYLPEVFVVM